MIALIQRVTHASVMVDNQLIGEIGAGLLVLLGVERGDDEQKAKRLCDKVLGYRVFSDEEGKMNLNVRQSGGSVLVVSQFTLAADTQKGMRPGFPAALRRMRLSACIPIFPTPAAPAGSPPRPDALLPICRSPAQ